MLVMLLFYLKASRKLKSSYQTSWVIDLAIAYLNPSAKLSTNPCRKDNKHAEIFNKEKWLAEKRYLLWSIKEV